MYIWDCLSDNVVSCFPTEMYPLGETQDKATTKYCPQSQRFRHEKMMQPMIIQALNTSTLLLLY